MEKNTEENIILFKIDELEISLGMFEPLTLGKSFKEVCILVNAYNSIKESFKTLDILQKIVIKAKESEKV